ncbi:MAG TPA: glycosyltransferase family 2 protein [Kiritimatiellia bacterium]|mgnify:CR=1 FL=1|nr:glycosyltransferase family 2 protein [Kiritimatiellia bacterium]
MLTVITCTLNPRPKVFRRVMDALAAQTLDRSEWDYLVVDNGSDTPVEQVCDVGWRRDVKVVREPERGLTRARLRGIAESQNPLLVFVDDDVVLNPDYLANVAGYFGKYPFLGVVGGCGHAEYECSYPEWMKEFLGLVMDERFAPVAKANFQFAMVRQAGPWIPAGSGMAVRREIADAYRSMVLGDPFRLDLDRKGGGLAGCGDTDMAYTAIDLGMASATALDLQFTHVIPPHRVEPRYMERLLYATNFYSARLLVHRGWRQAVASPPRTLLNRIRHALSFHVPRAWPDRCWRAYAKGYNDGITGSPFDPHFL